jgi:uncharacterized cupredoxin-like copper-binding protein
MRRSVRIVVAVAVGAAAATIGYGFVGAAEGAPVAGPGVVTIEVDIRDSRFELDVSRVRAGTLARFVVHNHDPINHEFVIGDASVHARHARGTGASHPPVQGEVSVGALESGVTIFEFDEPGRVEIACHLPRHYEYGMRDWVEVVA